uniref:Uncharacterized protein n=1 Tax=Anguilla anguilla TaxID=7936 RepID=A0A0E9WU53_ANGAN
MAARVSRSIALGHRVALKMSSVQPFQFEPERDITQQESTEDSPHHIIKTKTTGGQRRRE